MYSFRVFLIFLAVASATTHIKTIEVVAFVRLHCQQPWGKTAYVFLMEDDFADNVIDEDETLDFQKYYYGQQNKMRLYGEEFEWSGIEPYIYVSHTCVKQNGAWDSIRVELMKNMYKSRIFDVDINLDTGNVTFTHQKLH